MSYVFNMWIALKKLKWFDSLVIIRGKKKILGFFFYLNVKFYNNEKNNTFTNSDLVQHTKSTREECQHWYLWNHFVIIMCLCETFNNIFNDLK